MHGVTPAKVALAESLHELPIESSEINNGPGPGFARDGVAWLEVRAGAASNAALPAEDARSKSPG